eukprot:2612150-Heterocapsa_arctica.AAC.1
MGRVGVDPGPPRSIVVATTVARDREVKVASNEPAGSSVLMTAYRYGPSRYHLGGVDLSTQNTLSVMVTEAMLNPEWLHRLAVAGSDDKVFDILTDGLTLEEDG